MASPFQYSPLSDSGQWVRILFLEPSISMDAPLRGHLADADLAKLPEYHAVSYLWGDPTAQPTDSCELMVSGSKEYSRLPLLNNCSDALRHLRWEQQVRPLWIDAICIDQSNGSERGHQVQMMEFIYKEASQVVVWLDLKDIPTSSFKRVLRLADRLSRMFKMGYVRLSESDMQKDATWYIKLLERYFHIKSGHLRDTIMLILDNPYFGRTWTIQELVAAVLRNIVVVTHAGQIQLTHMLALAQLELPSAVSYTRDERTMRVHRRLSCRGAFSNIKEPLQQPLSGMRLAQTWSLETSHYPFEDVSSLLASDPRDKAYAFLWALPRGREKGLDIFNVDYTKSIETVFTEFTVAVAHETGDILPLLYMSCQKHRLLAVPSWVPDWTTAPRFEEWSFWRRLGSDSRGILKEKNHEFRYLSQEITFAHGAMVVSGLSQTDRVSRRERLPFLSGDKGVGLETVFLHHYDPRNFEKLVVSLYDIFKMLDGVEDIFQLADLYNDPPRPTTAKNDKPKPLKDHYRPETVAFLIIRGVICTYMQAKKSKSHCDVDIEKWQGSVRTELANVLTEDMLEKTVLYIPKLGGPGTLNPWGVENHMVSELISWFMMEAKIDVFWPVAEVASGQMGAVVFKTESGRVGLAQANVEVGDDIVQWEGAPCPMIIRRLEGEAPDDLPEGFHCRLVSVAKVAGSRHTDDTQWQTDNPVRYIVA